MWGASHLLQLKDQNVMLPALSRLALAFFGSSVPQASHFGRWLGGIIDRSVKYVFNAPSQNI